MSYTSVYAVYKTKATNLKELRNGYGSGSAIWDYIALKLTGKKLPMFDKLDWFWPLWKDPRLNDNERAVLLSTYDYAVVEVEYLKEFSKACKKVSNSIISDTEWTWNHFADIGEQSEILSKKHDYRCVGLGIGCTSVCDPWEFWEPKEKECWGVYDSINKLNNPSPI